MHEPYYSWLKQVAVIGSIRSLLNALIHIYQTNEIQFIADVEKPEIIAALAACEERIGKQLTRNSLKTNKKI